MSTLLDSDTPCRNDEVVAERLRGKTLMQCRICGDNQEHAVYCVKEMMLGLRGEHIYFQCSNCNCLQIQDIPESLSEYYPNDYYSYNIPKTSNRLKRRLVRRRDFYAATGKSRLGYLLNLFMPHAKLNTLRPLHLTRDTSILNVGCGDGNLLFSLREFGFTNLLDIDPFNREDPHYPNGLKIEKCDIINIQGQWDVIMFHHSFEHLPSQQETLQQAHTLLKENGTVLLRIPTVSSYAWEHYGIHWSQLDAPRHLFLHSVESMGYLASQTGFEIVQIIYDSNAFQFWSGEKQYKQNIPLGSPALWIQSPDNPMFSKKQIRRFERRARELNALKQGDQAAFYLRNRASKSDLTSPLG